MGDSGPLRNLTFAEIDKASLNLTLSQFVDGNGEWKWDEFQYLLPMSINLQIVVVPPPHVPDSVDSCSWQLTKNGDFSVSSAYCSIEETSWLVRAPSCRLIWKWPGPQRIRSFLWLATSGKLLTNSECARRHLTEDPRCELCGAGIEDSHHIFRACPLALTCWQILIPDGRLRRFTSQSLDGWWRENLNIGQSGLRWCVHVGILTWKFREAQNKRLFAGESFTTRAILAATEAMALHTAKAMNLSI